MEAIREAKCGDPLVHLQSLQDEISAIDDNGTGFQHADADEPGVQAVPTEVLSFARQTLSLIQRG